MDRRDAMKATAGLLMGAAAAANAQTPVMNRIPMKIQNPKKPTAHELKHTPLITVGDKDEKGFTLVEVSLGQGGIIHPSIATHWIDFIELYADDALVGKNVLEAVVSRGYSAYRVDLENVASLRAVGGCNLHGIWEYTLSLS